MQDPEPPKPPINWTPTQSTVGGGILGQLAGQLIVAFCDQYLSHPLSPELATAIAGFLTVAGVYFIPDRKT